MESFIDEIRNEEIMKRLEVFDPPMCCSTGVCGPTVDPALVKFAADLHWLANQRIAVERYNLAQQPQAFAANAQVKSSLHDHGNECLPLILLDGSIVSEGRYPTREELARLAGVQTSETPEANPSTSSNAVKLPVINKCC
jgi:hypothetical protein